MHALSKITIHLFCIIACAVHACDKFYREVLLNHMLQYNVFLMNLGQLFQCVSKYVNTSTTRSNTIQSSVSI